MNVEQFISSERTKRTNVLRICLIKFDPIYYIHYTDHEVAKKIKNQKDDYRHSRNGEKNGR